MYNKTTTDGKKVKDDKIKPLALGLHNARNKRKELAEKMKEHWTVHFLDILEESKDREHAKELNISNEKGREIELENRLRQDADYMKAKAAHDKVSNDIELIAIDLEHERNAFRVWYVDSLKMINGIE